MGNEERKSISTWFQKRRWDIVELRWFIWHWMKESSDFRRDDRSKIWKQFGSMWLIKIKRWRSAVQFGRYRLFESVTIFFVQPLRLLSRIVDLWLYIFFEQGWNFDVGRVATWSPPVQMKSLAQLLVLNLILYISNINIMGAPSLLTFVSGFAFVSGLTLVSRFVLKSRTRSVQSFCAR